jgi:class 3 adenylate cyclase/predicted ATPase
MPPRSRGVHPMSLAHDAAQPVRVGFVNLREPASLHGDPAPLTCPSCGSTNEAGRKFCGECGARLAIACSACGTPNSPTSRFCGECGTPLAVTTAALPAATFAPAAGPSPATPGAGPVAERRLVSVLFADLVGFTTLAEGRDPEVVRELLSRYFDLASEIVARYGGTVEKFIGDAVMAMWGAPTAHEDDAERAVRAALELVASVPTLGEGIDARCGVLTGEAAVTLGATDQGMVAGDLVNTAARLQGVAPPGAVLVGEATKLATSLAIAYEPAGDQALKGKAAPVPAFRALRVVAERGGRGRDDRLEAPFVGRDAELRLLKDLFHATSRERRVRLVSITGQAGIGKSRLAWEFLKYVDGIVADTWWHEGRSPAYGEGITFWALGEMIRARAGLAEGDDPATTRQRIAEMLEEHVPDEGERRRLEPSILALLGVGEAPEGGQNELFSAWRTFFERLAGTGVVALLFEDLHWADPGTLDFIEHLVEWSRGVPILIITLARPELLDRRPDWGAGKRAFLALDLQPLDDEAMRELLAGVVPDLPEVAIRSIISRAEGIPLYAVETMRMLVADGRLIGRDGGGFEPVGDLGELAVPPTLHALIAARLDALDPGDRALLQDAAVLGQSFTADALAVVATERADHADRLERLVRGELLRLEVDPSSPERGQYEFVGSLIREVAYATLSLRDRRSRHLAAARHFEAIGDDELAGALAMHYLAAHRSSTEGPETDAVAVQARLALRGAADRAIALGSPAQAVAFLDQALEITTDRLQAAELHELAVDACLRAAMRETVLVHAAAAEDVLRERGERSRLARILAARGRALSFTGRTTQALAVLNAAVSELADLEEADPGFLAILDALSSAYLGEGDFDRMEATADRLLGAAERANRPEFAVPAMLKLGTVAFVRGRLWLALALARGARQIAEELDLADLSLNAVGQLASFTALDDPRDAVEVQRAGITLARRLGRRSDEIVLVGNASEDARRVGEWDWALAEQATSLGQDIDEWTKSTIRSQRGFYQVHRSLVPDDEVMVAVEWLLGHGDSDYLASGHDLHAQILFAEGRWLEAAEAWMQVVPVSEFNIPYVVPRAGRAAVLGGDPVLARRAIELLAGVAPRGRAISADRTAIAAGAAGLDGDRGAALAGYREAWTVFDELGLPWDRALMSIEAASVVGADDPEVAAWVEEGRGILARLGAARMGERLEEVVARASASPADRGDRPGAGRNATVQDGSGGRSRG